MSETLGAASSSHVSPGGRELPNLTYSTLCFNRGPILKLIYNVNYPYVVERSGTG